MLLQKATISQNADSGNFRETDFKSEKIRVPITYSSRHDREVAPVRPQQCGFVNRTQIMATPINMSVWMGKVFQGPALDEEKQVIRY